MILKIWQKSVQTLFSTDVVSEGTYLITLPKYIQRKEILEDWGVALIIGGMTTLRDTIKGVFLVVGPISMPVETLAIETMGLGARTVEALPSVEMVRAKEEPIKREALSKGWSLSPRWLS